MSVEPRRGEVWFVDVPGDKRRPVVVLTRDSVMPRLTTVLVVPVTIRIRDIPTEVPLGCAQGAAKAVRSQLRQHHAVAERTACPKGRLGMDELRQACAAARFAIQCQSASFTPGHGLAEIREVRRHRVTRGCF